MVIHRVARISILVYIYIFKPVSRTKLISNSFEIYYLLFFSVFAILIKFFQGFFINVYIKSFSSIRSRNNSVSISEIHL